MSSLKSRPVLLRYWRWMRKEGCFLTAICLWGIAHGSTVLASFMSTWKRIILLEGPNSENTPGRILYGLIYCVFSWLMIDLEDPAQCGQCHLWTACPGWTKKVGRESWLLYLPLPPGSSHIWVHALIFLRKDFDLEQYAEVNISSTSYLWVW